MSDKEESLQSLPRSEQTGASSWKQKYLALGHNTDVKRLTQAVMAAETAIYVRMQEFSGESDHWEERAAIEAANKELLKIKTQKLGWPNPSS